jgi:hypothetical protein
VILVTIEDSAIMPEAFFTVDGDSYLPGEMTRGPWGAAMGGQIVGGLLGWGIERSGIDAEFQPARFTVDLLHPVLLEPVQIHTSVQREGRRIKLVDGTLVQNGTTVARASALFLRRGDHPDGRVWSSPVEMPPLPTGSDGFPADMPFLIWGYGATLEGSPGIAAGEWEQSHSQSRLPDDEFIGLAAQSHYGTAGVATGAATLFDRHGPIGTSSALALAQPAEAFQPSYT